MMYHTSWHGESDIFSSGAIKSIPYLERVCNTHIKSKWNGGVIETIRDRSPIETVCEICSVEGRGRDVEQHLYNM